MLLAANSEYAAGVLSRYYAGQERRLPVEAYEQAVKSMELAKRLLTPSRQLFPSFFSLLSQVRGPPPPPQLPQITASSVLGSAAGGGAGSTRLGPLYTYWLTSPALERIEEGLEEFSTVCPAGSHVVGFEGMAWSTRDARPWGATRGGMFTTVRAARGASSWGNRVGAHASARLQAHLPFLCTVCSWLSTLRTAGVQVPVQ